ncbi:MAG: carbon storage regulator [Marinobacterium sp.]|nr:carbon storage regulator [Marinobacterium sp.]
MLILSVYRGDATTITTPAGETITVRFLGQDGRHANCRIGIDAPNNHKILREELRQKLQAQLSGIPVYEVTSTNPTMLIAAQNHHEALAYYLTQHPDSQSQQAQWLQNPPMHRLYKQLECLWLARQEIPVGV